MTGAARRILSPFPTYISEQKKVATAAAKSRQYTTGVAEYEQPLLPERIRQKRYL